MGDSITIHIMFDSKNPPGKVAEADIRFNDGLLSGLKLIGFGIWERRGGGGFNVTFPARQYYANGEHRSFALLRPIVDSGAQDRLRDAIIAEYERQAEAREV